MDQQLIILYLTRKGLAVVVICDDLVATLGAEAMRYPLVTRYLREAKSATSNPEVTFLNRSVNIMIATKPFCPP
jgi:hypothetical protein